MNSHCQSLAYIFYKTLMIITIIRLGKFCCIYGLNLLTYQELLYSAFIQTVLLTVVHMCVFQASLQIPTCAYVFIELCVCENQPAHIILRGPCNFLRGTTGSQRNKICSPCFDRQEPACNYKLSFSLANFLVSDSIISVPATIWVQKRQLNLKHLLTSTRHSKTFLCTWTHKIIF